MKQRNQFHRKQCETQFWQTVLISVLGLVIGGCSLTIPSVSDGEGTSSSNASEQAPAEEIWHALARAVEVRTIENTTQLAQYVVVLARNGDLSAQDVAAFDVAFPQIATVSRTLTETDINTLIGLCRDGTK